MLKFFLSVYPGRHRWVMYTTEMNGKNTLWEVDGSMVPAEWYDKKLNAEFPQASMFKQNPIE